MFREPKADTKLKKIKTGSINNAKKKTAYVYILMDIKAQANHIGMILPTDYFFFFKKKKRKDQK